MNCTFPASLRTTCTATAPDAVRTFRTYATARIYPLSTPNHPAERTDPQVSELHSKLSTGNVLSQEAEGKADADDVATGWQKLRAKVSGDFDTLRENAGKRHATHQAKHADRRADNAECDAEDAIEFAIYALEEAEYYVLAAAEARVEAVDAELNADIKNAE